MPLPACDPLCQVSVRAIATRLLQQVQRHNFWNVVRLQNQVEAHAKVYGWRRSAAGVVKQRIYTMTTTSRNSARATARIPQERMGGGIWYCQSSAISRIGGVLYYFNRYPSRLQLGAPWCILIRKSSHSCPDRGLGCVYLQ